MTLFLRSIASLGSLFLISCLAHEEVVQLPTTPRPQDGDPDQTKVEIEDLPDGGKRMVVSNQCSTETNFFWYENLAFSIRVPERQPIKLKSRFLIPVFSKALV
ncbi:MAG: hypothetical protein HYW02_03950 [Deltaproteobacteria bacterium]|nr:hypothetical protein [Deltaproteobacteria bacterium]